jgi:hypothetical protein
MKGNLYGAIQVNKKCCKDLTYLWKKKPIIRRLRKKPCNHYLQRHGAVTEIALYGQKTILRLAVQKGYVKRLEMKREGCKIVGDLVISNAFPKLFFFFGSSSSQNCRIIRAGYNLRPPYYDSQ